MSGQLTATFIAMLKKSKSTYDRYSHWLWQTENTMHNTRRHMGWCCFQLMLLVSRLHISGQGLFLFLFLHCSHWVHKSFSICCSFLWGVQRYIRAAAFNFELHVLNPLWDWNRKLWQKILQCITFYVCLQKTLAQPYWKCLCCCRFDHFFAWFNLIQVYLYPNKELACPILLLLFSYSSFSLYNLWVGRNKAPHLSSRYLKSGQAQSSMSVRYCTLLTSEKPKSTESHQYLRQWYLWPAVC